MKKTIILLTTLLVAMGAMAQSVDETTLINARREFHKAHNNRIPLPRTGMKSSEPTKMTGANSTASQLPADRWFPGEWEEVQAIVVTWPYWSVPANWEELGNQLGNYSAVPCFSGYGDIYQYTNNNWRWLRYGPIDQLPYCVNYTVNASNSSDMSFISVFAYLIDAIRQGGAEPWVRVTHLSDSTYIKQHLDYLGLATTGIKWIEGFGDSFWFRDCGPICFYYGEGDTVGMLDFQYYSGRAIDDSLPQIINSQKNIPIWTTSIEWEGGNCIVDGDGFVMSSNHIYTTNADSDGQVIWAGTSTSPTSYESKSPLSQQQVRDSLAYLMGPRGVKILPAFRYDGGTGHVDLYADMYDENLFIFSLFPEAYSHWTDYTTAAKNIDSICSWQSTFGNNFKKTYIPFPSKNNGSNFASQTEYDQNYTRSYSNHTFINNLIVQPCFSKVVNGMPTAEWDRKNIEIIKQAYRGYTIYPIDVRSFDGNGGAIHCITKQIPAENPVRILHPSITGNTEQSYTSTDAPIHAIITNNSGIESAKIVYRVDSAEWHEIPLVAGADNSFDATIPTSTITFNDHALIEYYISATTNNGKTVTKPFPASQGGYYSFYIGNYVGIEDVEFEENFGQFYPNPATDKANLNINLGNGGNYNVTIIDNSGRTVHTSSLQTAGQIVYTINASRLASGVYNVVFSNDDSRIVRRLIVK